MRTNQFLSSFSCFLSRLVFPQMIHILHAESFVQQVKRVSFPPWHRKWSWQTNLSAHLWDESLGRSLAGSNGTMLKQIDRAWHLTMCQAKVEKPDVFSEGDLGFEKAGNVGLQPNENITKALDVKKPPIHERILLIGTGNLRVEITWRLGSFNQTTQSLYGLLAIDTCEADYMHH